MRDLHYISALKFFKAVAMAGTLVFVSCFIFARQMVDLQTRSKWLMNKFTANAEQRIISFKIGLS